MSWSNRLLTECDRIEEEIWNTLSEGEEGVASNKLLIFLAAIMNIDIGQMKECSEGDLVLTSKEIARIHREFKDYYNRKKSNSQIKKKMDLLSEYTFPPRLCRSPTTARSYKGLSYNLLTSQPKQQKEEYVRQLLGRGEEEKLVAERTSRPQLETKSSYSPKSTKDDCRNLIELASEVLTLNKNCEDPEDLAQSDVNAQIRDHAEKTRPDERREEFLVKLKSARRELGNKSESGVNLYEELSEAAKKSSEFFERPAYQCVSTASSANKFGKKSNRNKVKKSFSTAKEVSDPIMNIDVILEDTKERITVHSDDTATSLVASFALKHRKVCVNGIELTEEKRAKLKYLIQSYIDEVKTNNCLCTRICSL
eukprot:TRINITY_DN4002_c0_g1_i1.p1 TRINITY_DN4002_c0_g1~~TRINITY_DN4002_c0_g1_i1.p1  ORF type:complete len:367 (+),score=88.00 TRINITY_DN4002_c0_g1_i1:1099-2199(+)